MLIKAGVDISRLRPEIRKKLNGIERLLDGQGEKLIITSTYEGNHSASSLHYANLAIDLRRPDARGDFFPVTLKTYLGPDYDIVFYEKHIHIEYDPK